MSDANRKTRLSPPLMFAFRDAHRARDAKLAVGQRTAGGQEVVGSRKSLRIGVSEPELRAELSHDLSALMNTTNLEGVVPLDDEPRLRDSILNFGLPDIVHRSLDEQRTERITDEIRGALAAFEPRLIRDTLKVRRDMSVDAAQLVIRFVISAEMSCDPVAVPVEFIADMDVGNGDLAIRKK
jgi:type VI secretion system protein ImpF